MRQQILQYRLALGLIVSMYIFVKMAEDWEGEKAGVRRLVLYTLRESNENLPDRTVTVN